MIIRKRRQAYSLYPFKLSSACLCWFAAFTKQESNRKMSFCLRSGSHHHLTVNYSRSKHFRYRDEQRKEKSFRKYFVGLLTIKCKLTMHVSFGDLAIYQTNLRVYAWSTFLSRSDGFGE